VLIVGAGFGGLACAIQSRIEGHEVHIFEQFDQMIKLGIPSANLVDGR
jgi:phytoene dehydrogenase-like protein